MYRVQRHLPTVRGIEKINVTDAHVVLCVLYELSTCGVLTIEITDGVAVQTGLTPSFYLSVQCISMYLK